MDSCSLSRYSSICIHTVSVSMVAYPDVSICIHVSPYNAIKPKRRKGRTEPPDDSSKKSTLTNDVVRRNDAQEKENLINGQGNTIEAGKQGRPPDDGLHGQKDTSKYGVLVWSKTTNCIIKNWRKETCVESMHAVLRARDQVPCW